MVEKVGPERETVKRAVSAEGGRVQKSSFKTVTTSSGRITREMLSRAHGAPQDSDRDLIDEKLEAQKKLVEIHGRRAFFQLRSQWSSWIIYWITSFIVFHVILTFCVGMGWLNFEKYQWFVPLVVIENFLQICGMGYIVVQFLYPPERGKL